MEIAVAGPEPIDAAAATADAAAAAGPAASDAPAPPRFFPYGEVELAALSAADPKLAPVIAQVEAAGHICRPMDDDLFASVVHHIIGQQISTAAQQTIWNRLRERFGAVTPEALAAADAAEVQACGMTFRKAAYVRDFAEKVMGGQFDLDVVAALPDEEAIAALCTLAGIGRWTAEMILLFCLGRPDVLSFGDLAIQRGMRMVYRHRALAPALFAKYRRRLSPYGSTASLFFWEVSHGAVPGLTDPALKKRK